MTTTRRTMLGLLGASAASGAALAAAAAPASAATAGAAGATARHGARGGADGGIPEELRPGGEFDRFVREQAEAGEFSGSVLLTYHGRPVLARSYGMADQARGIENGPGTRFALASVTKLFTAVAIAQLAEAGEIDYARTVGTYLDGFPEEVAGKVTVHHLLTHTSGLGDLFQIPGFEQTAAGWTTLQQAMDGATDLIRGTGTDFTPGAGWQYSNSGYHVLGAIVQEVSGRSYFDYIREHVFRAAGMTDSDFFTAEQWRTDPSLAHPYALQPSGEREDVVDRKNFVGSPSGDAFATSGDMARFADALLGERLAGPAFTEITLGGKLPNVGSMQGPGQPAPAAASNGAAPAAAGPARAMFQCYGPMRVLLNGQWGIGHSGGSQGESTDVQMYPAGGWVSVVLSNIDYPQGTFPPVVEKARVLITGTGE
ncbi:serine hydrolase domain-containing protein [Streptomyces hoynatensis]|uniref:Class A beta-lactamase-related serine hydrolase n=1 Tax=Streptomyces hoynatensis TaxID=1141874 RepID=A0A3A9ZFB9_9ACTN|nr:serine hydrolase domain-containing protein [Streptomyces hoynatensis]RKN47040.1 class A beta-lactamase-related serine hydrolase [Streptomyces hoynatensis]